MGLSVVSQVGTWEDVGLVVWGYCSECAEAEVQPVALVEGVVGASSGLLLLFQVYESGSGPLLDTADRCPLVLPGAPIILPAPV